MKSALGLAACLALGITGALAQDLPAEPRFSETTLLFDIKDGYSNLTLSVSGPNGFHASASSKTGSPNIELRRLGPLDDGSYRYQLSATSGEKLVVRTPLDDGRSKSGAAPLKIVTASGRFEVKGGAIVKPAATPPGRKDQQ
jgi:hypothetical protein